MSIKLSDKILACYYTGIPCLIWGDPGSGKTSSVKHVAEKLGKHLETIISSIREPGDFYGIPYVDNGEMKVSVPKWALNYSEKDGGILFFDEISTCNLSIQAALLSIILDGKVGEYQLSRNVYRMAASNFTNCTGNNELNPALGNRFIHIVHKVNVEEYIDFLKCDFDYALYKLNISEGLDYLSNRKLASEWIVDFLGGEGRSYYNKPIPEEIKNPMDYAFPTCRSWSNVLEVVSRLMNCDKKLLHELINGCIGNEAGDEFFTYIKYRIDCDWVVSEHITDYEKFTEVIVGMSFDEISHVMKDAVSFYRIHKDDESINATKIMEFYHKTLIDFGYVAIAESYKDELESMGLVLLSNVIESNNLHKGVDLSDSFEFHNLDGLYDYINGMKDFKIESVDTKANSN